MSQDNKAFLKLVNSILEKTAPRPAAQPDDPNKKKCRYCGMRNESQNTLCSQCGAPL